jgi:hypothetical protein
MMDKGKAKTALVDRMDNYKTAKACWDDLKKMEIQLKVNQEKSLRKAGDMVSTLDLDFNDAQMSVIACANDVQKGFQYLHMCTVEKYDIANPEVRYQGDDE